MPVYKIQYILVAKINTSNKSVCFYAVIVVIVQVCATPISDKYHVKWKVVR